MIIKIITFFCCGPYSFKIINLELTLVSGWVSKISEMFPTVFPMSTVSFSVSYNFCYHTCIMAKKLFVKTEHFGLENRIEVS